MLSVHSLHGGHSQLCGTHKHPHGHRLVEHRPHESRDAGRGNHGGHRNGDHRNGGCRGDGHHSNECHSELALLHEELSGSHGEYDCVLLAQHGAPRCIDVE